MSLTQDETERLLQEALKGAPCPRSPGCARYTDTAKLGDRGSCTARDGSYCVYSNFRVGACLLTADGHYVRGANVEACNYAGTICAERTAIVKAVSDGQRTFKALAVASDLREPISPCGFCRQLLREFCRLDVSSLPTPQDEQAWSWS